MSSKLTKLELEALRLSVRERARLVRRLLKSLESEDDGDVEQAWLDEAERRLARYRRGETDVHPGEEVFEAILNRI